MMFLFELIDLVRLEEFVFDNNKLILLLIGLCKFINLIYLNVFYNLLSVLLDEIC